MNLLNILSIEVQQSLKDSMFIIAMVIVALFIILTISLSLRNYEVRQQVKKLKKWRKFSEIEKDQLRADSKKISYELAEERKFSETQGDMHVRLLLRFAELHEENDKFKKEIEDYKFAVKDLNVEIDQLKAKLTRPTQRDEKGRFVKTEPDAKPAPTERDWTQASKEELLAEAKRRYPVGTKVKCLHDQPYNLIDTDNFEYDKYGSCMRHVDTKNYVCCVYEFGKWAEIITK